MYVRELGLDVKPTPCWFLLLWCCPLPWFLVMWSLECPVKKIFYYLKLFFFFFWVSLLASFCVGESIKQDVFNLPEPFLTQHSYVLLHGASRYQGWYLAKPSVSMVCWVLLDLAPWQRWWYMVWFAPCNSIIYEVLLVTGLFHQYSWIFCSD